jgi:hypothetical protein
VTRRIVFGSRAKPQAKKAADVASRPHSNEVILNAQVSCAFNPTLLTILTMIRMDMTLPFQFPGFILTGRLFGSRHKKRVDA